MVITMERIPITTTGYKELEREIKQLKSVERPKVIQAIAEARAHGDLKENAEYHAAKERQGFIEGRLQELEAIYSRAEIIDPQDHSGSTIVKFSATVHLVDEETDEEVHYQIVSEYEADLENGKISLTAPITRALIGKEQGESVVVTTPKGERYYEILGIKYVG